MILSILIFDCDMLISIICNTFEILTSWQCNNTYHLYRKIWVLLEIITCLPAVKAFWKTVDLMKLLPWWTQCHARQLPGTVSSGVAGTSSSDSGVLGSAPPNNGDRYVIVNCSINDVPYFLKYHHSNICNNKQQILNDVTNSNSIF